MSTTTTTTAVRISAGWLWLFRLGLPAVGFGLAFGVKPLFHWLASAFDVEPTALRIAAELPLHWSILALTVLGLIAGVVIAEMAKEDALVLIVDGDHVLAERKGEERYLPREQIAGVFLDRKELVFVDGAGRELHRDKADDLPKPAVENVFRKNGYPWQGTEDPREREFTVWVDGKPDLDDELHASLRARGRAVADKKSGEAASLREQLQERGLVVRDRDGKQQYRRL